MRYSDYVQHYLVCVWFGGEVKRIEFDRIEFERIDFG